MNVLRFELKKYLPSSIVWAISVTFFGVLCIQLFVSFEANLSFLETILQAYSSDMLQAFGIQLAMIKTLPGFYSFCFQYVMLVAAFYALYLGMHVLGKEISGKTTDFLFSKPMNRNRILTYKISSVILCILLFNMIYGIGVFLSAMSTLIVFDREIFLMIHIAMFLTQCLFASLGFLLSCALCKIKSPLSLTTGIICVFFLLQMVVNMNPDGMLAGFSFLSYVSADYIVQSGGFEPLRVCLLLLLMVCFIGSGYYIFYRRDLHAG